MRPLKFCMITTFYPPQNFGGDGIFIHRLSNELAKAGHSVDVIHDVDAYRSLGRPGRAPGRAPPERHAPSRSRSRAGILSPLLTQQTGAPWLKRKKIARVLEKGHDVVHFHNVSLVGGPKVLAMGGGIKLYTTHEHWLVCPTHVLFKFNREPCFEKECLQVRPRPPAPAAALAVHRARSRDRSATSTGSSRRARSRCGATPSSGSTCG